MNIICCPGCDCEVESIACNQCDGCKRIFCDDCLTEDVDGSYCDRCRGEA